MAYTEADVDGALNANPDYAKSDAKTKEQWRANALLKAGLKSKPPATPPIDVTGQGDEATTPARVGSPYDVFKPAILPTIGQVGGGIIGGRFGGPRGAMIGESIGGGAGGLANQALGITEPSISEPLIDAAVPPSVRGLVGAARIGKNMYGQTGAANVNRLLPEEAAARVNEFMPSTPASHLFQQAEQQGTLVPMAPAMQSLDDTTTFINSLSSGTRKQYKEALSIAKGLQDKITANGGNLSPIDLQNELAGLNRSITKLQRGGAPGIDKLMAVKEGMLDALDQAAQAGTPGAQTLQSARHTYMRQESVKELGDYIDNAMTVKRGVGGDTQWNANQVLNKIKKDRFFTKAFGPAEQDEIIGMLEMMNKAPAIGPGAGQHHGFGRLGAQLTTAGVLGGGSHIVTGNPEVAAAAAAVGMAIPPITDVARNIALTMQTSNGRKFLKGLLMNSNGAITPQVITALGEFTGGMTATAKQPQPVSEARTRIQPMDVQP